MNNVYFNSQEFKNTNIYKDYINDNKGTGYLNIRAYAANLAIPIKNLKVVVSKKIDNLNIIFFEGNTNDSGIISQINLPTPEITTDNLEIPPSQEYDVIATYNNEELIYKIKMFSNIQVLQNISVVPSIRLDGSYYGS